MTEADFTSPDDSFVRSSGADRLLEAEIVEAEIEAAEAEHDVERVLGEVQRLKAEATTLTSDLQRIQAEYVNYRKRVERDREAVREQAVAGALQELLPILDDVGRARAQGELEGVFRAVGESLENAVAKLGLEKFGAVDEAFDPMLHEALTREDREGVEEPTVVVVYQDGYRIFGRVIRPARVSVAGA